VSALEHGLKASLERWIHKHGVELLPGLALVIAIMEYLVKELQEEATREGPQTWLYILVAAFSIYALGKAWDEVLFDPLFSVPDPTAGWFTRTWRLAMTPLRWLAESLPPARRLQEARHEAGCALNEERANGRDFAGLHKTAARLVTFTKDWNEEVKPWLDRSKTARSFLLPLIFLTVFRYRWPSYPWRFPESFLSRLWLWQWDAALLAVSLLAYVWLRLMHMRRLYELISKKPIEPAEENIYAAYLIATAELPYLATPLSVDRVGTIRLLPGPPTTMRQ
jgi:hypothetical protein